VKSSSSPSRFDFFFDLYVKVGILLGGVIFSTHSVLGFVLPKIIVFQGFLILGLTLLWIARKPDLRALWRSWPGRVVLLYFGLLCAYTFFSITPLISFFGASPELQGLLTQILYFSAFIFALAYAKSLYRPLLLLNGVVVFYGLLQLLHLDPWAAAWDAEGFLGRIFSTLGNPNFLGSFIVLTLPILFEKIKQHKSFGLLIVANLIVLIGTASKAALIGLIVVGVLALFSYASSLRQIQAKIWIGSGLIFALLIAFTVYTFHERNRVDFEAFRSFGAREVIWGDTIEMIQARPLGYGLETFSLVYPQFQSPEFFEYEKFTSSADRAHNLILDLWVAAGPLAPLLFLILLGLLIKIGYRSPETRGTILGLIGYVVSLLFGFETFLTGIVFWMMIGFIVSKISLPMPSHKSVIFSRMIFGLMIAVLIVTIPFPIRHFQADRYYTQAEATLNSAWDQSVIAYSRAISLYPYDLIYPLKDIEVHLVILENVEDPHDEIGEDISKFIEESLEELRPFDRGFGASPFLLEAWFIMLTGDPETVEPLLEQGRTLAPNQPNTYKITGHIYELLGKTEQAALEYEKIRALLPSYLEDETSDASRIFRKENTWLNGLIMVK